MNQITKTGQQALKVYFAQTENYYSESSEVLIKIADMHPTYAANAAARLLKDHHTWGLELTGSSPSTPRWLMKTALWNALVSRAVED